MKKVVILFALFLAYANGTPKLLPYKEGDRFIYFPDDDGRMHLVDLNQEVAEDEPRVSADNIRFLLFTRSNRNSAQIITLNDNNSVGNSNFSNRRTMFIVHGWRSNENSGVNTMVRESALNDQDVNIVVVDWSYYASSANYNAAVRNVSPVGVIVAEFIDFLNTIGLHFGNVHLVGFSLGGHVVGVAGRNCKRGRIPRITSLDPAGPAWGPNNMQRISQDDGKYVEVIHTNEDFLGNRDLLGHVDFFPNGGKMQPGCFISNSCSHSRAYEYYRETIGNTSWMGIKCDNINDARKGRCTGEPSYHMGGSWDNKNGRGIYWLETNSRSPFM